jgi:hypothetical protein
VGLLRFSIALAAASAASLFAAGPGCAGCSEECSGDNQGAETCPCASDQDCTTNLGTVLLCVEGACAVADPPAAAPLLGACDDEGQCGAGQACGIDDICFAAAQCQRIEVPLAFRNGDGDTGTVTASVDDCTHTWSVAAGAGGSFDATFTINLDGDLVDLEGCDQGHWFAADRVGELTCEGVRWAIAAVEPPVNTCVLDCAAPCELIGESVGVCP